MNRKNAFAFLLAAELMLYLSCLYLDISQLRADLSGLARPADCFLLPYVKYSSVLGCLLYTYLCYGWTPLTRGILFSALADFFMLFTGLALPGVVLFCVVQFYYTRNLPPSFRQYGPFLWLPAFLLAFALILAGTPLLSAALWLPVSALFYLCLLCNNLASSYAFWQSTRRDSAFCFFFGLLLLFLGDLHVGFSNVPQTAALLLQARTVSDGLLPWISAPNLAASFSAPFWQNVSLRCSYMIWFLYLPSVFFISVSRSLPFRHRRFSRVLQLFPEQAGK